MPENLDLPLLFKKLNFVSHLQKREFLYTLMPTSQPVSPITNILHWCGRLLTTDEPILIVTHWSPQFTLGFPLRTGLSFAKCMSCVHDSAIHNSFTTPKSSCVPPLCPSSLPPNPRFSFLITPIEGSISWS